VQILFHGALFDVNFALNYSNLRALLVGLHEKYSPHDRYENVARRNVEMPACGLLCSIHDDAARVQSNAQSVSSPFDRRLGTRPDLHTRPVGERQHGTLAVS
jgi:hypothetical protein